MTIQEAAFILLCLNLLCYLAIIALRYRAELKRDREAEQWVRSIRQKAMGRS